LIRERANLRTACSLWRSPFSIKSQKDSSWQIFQEGAPKRRGATKFIAASLYLRRETGREMDCHVNFILSVEPPKSNGSAFLAISLFVEETSSGFRGTALRIPSPGGEEMMSRESKNAFSFIDENAFEGIKHERIDAQSTARKLHFDEAL